MLKKIRRDTNPREVTRLKRRRRMRKKLQAQKGKVARLVVYRSNRYLYAQVVDDFQGQTLVQGNTREKEFSEKSSRKNREAARDLGKLVARRAMEKKVDRVVFDRNGYDYHGRIREIADGAREAGLRI